MPVPRDTPKAIPIWILFSTIVVIYDAMYILLRPYTFPPNPLSYLWPGHTFYATIDHVYGPSAFAENDGFPAAQSLMNLVESVVNITYLAKYYSTRAGGTGGGGMLVVGFAGVVMTLAKTVLYVLNEVCAGGRHVAHNDFKSLFLFYILPNGLWVAFPAWCTCWFSREITKRIEAGGSGKVKKRA
ncbi:unnamed protein product [Tuber aestivum]|uniref:EXPERA domain-containing protein n=1 Tax=Tuber aestivum TaxID=59557 RepID=A0A292PYY0_9PEZI|nr:unnamed protein product [Tuber aestivum]